MGAPKSDIEAVEQPAAETLLDAFKTISAAERRMHASVLNYWMSIRGDKEFPPLHDLDPLELSDAGPNSILLELISGGHDAEVRHLGEAVRFDGKVDRIIDAPAPSLLACIAKKLPLVAISRDFLAFEDEYETAEGKTRCWVTLLPLSAGGAWVDYVYALATFDGASAKGAKAKPKGKEPEPDGIADPAEKIDVEPESAALPVEEAEAAEPETVEHPVEEAEAAEPETAEDVQEPEQSAVTEAEEPAGEPVEPEDPRTLLESAEDQAPDSSAHAKPGFSKLLDNLAGLTGFYGHGYSVESGVTSDLPAAEEEPVMEQPAAEEPVAPAPATEEPASHDPATESAEPPATAEEIEEFVAEAAPSAEEPTAAEEPLELTAEPPVTAKAEDPAQVAPEGPLKNKLSDVRAKADEARAAKLRANSALYDGLSAAYDFALDAEDAPEEYLRLVEAEGLKIQLRSPMRPVVKLAFNGMCDDSTIRQLEAVLAWALDNELPRGSLAEQIEAAGGIGPILSGDAKAA
ncbi:MAG TPA: hypothetical protein VF067_03595 [Sphingomicrobium sp.]